MGFVVVSFLIAFVSLVIRGKTFVACGTVAACNDCEYDLAGLAGDAACPECGSRERKPAPPARSDIVIRFDRIGFMIVGQMAWALVAFAHLEFAKEVVLRSMIRAGFDAHAASVWVSYNSADNVVFDSANAKVLRAIALVCASVTPWLAVLPRRFAWLTGLGTLLVGVAAIGLAYAII